MGRLWIVGALLVAAFVVAGSASAAAAGGGTPTAMANGGCAVSGDPAPVAPARSRMPVATETAAIDWRLHPVASNVGINSPYVLLATGTHSAVVLAVARLVDRLILLATDDSGATWHATAKLHQTSKFTAASDGQSVDLLMAVARRTSDSLALPADTRGQQLLYQRSLNGGARWSASQKLGTLSYPEFGVARMGNNVAVAWWNERDQLRVRVSTDGGATFGSASTLATYPGSSGCVDPGPGQVGVAFSGRQILVTYLSGHGFTTLRRGLHGGSRWTQPDVLGTRDGFVPLAAHGKDVAVIVTPKLELLSHDSGDTWHQVANPIEAGSGHVNLAWSDGKWRVAYYDKDLAIRYRESTDAIHWSTSEVVATGSGADDVDVYGVAAAGTPLVLVATITGGMKVTDLEVATRD